MIFRKLLYGGFGILMSQIYQVKKILHFSVVLKWYDGSTFVLILTHQIITFNVFEDIRWCLQCLMLFGDVMGCLSESFGVSGWYFRILTIQGVPKKVGFRMVPISPGASVEHLIEISMPKNQNSNEILMNP